MDCLQFLNLLVCLFFRRHNYKWRLSPSIQDGCIFTKSSSSSSDFKISIQEVQSCLGHHIRGEYLFGSLNVGVHNKFQLTCIDFNLQVRHVILLFCQFVNHLEVTRLPIYYPSQQEKDDPKLYADNVRTLMAHEVCFFVSF